MKQRRLPSMLLGCFLALFGFTIEHLNLRFLGKTKHLQMSMFL
uniref:Uncharacterized protein n=1 Tax=Aegilops tauschii subsp. strangulata TaxID=200361 RepID=A0A452Z693_AEGTS